MSLLQRGRSHRGVMVPWDFFDHTFLYITYYMGRSRSYFLHTKLFSGPPDKISWLRPCMEVDFILKWLLKETIKAKNHGHSTFPQEVMPFWNPPLNMILLLTSVWSQKIMTSWPHCHQSTVWDTIKLIMDILTFKLFV